MKCSVCGSDHASTFIPGLGEVCPDCHKTISVIRTASTQEDVNAALEAAYSQEISTDAKVFLAGEADKRLLELQNASNSSKPAAASAASSNPDFQEMKKDIKLIKYIAIFFAVCAAVSLFANFYLISVIMDFLEFLEIFG